MHVVNIFDIPVNTVQIRKKLKDKKGIVKITMPFTRCFIFAYFRFDVTETQVMIMTLHLFNFLFGSYIWSFQVKLNTKYYLTPIYPSK